MKLQTYEQRILRPDEGKLLCNYKDKSISTLVVLGIDADVSDWSEIDVSEKERLEAEWEAEALAEAEL